MLKETETEEPVGFFVTFLSLVAFQFGGAGLLSFLTGYAYERRNRLILVMQFNSSFTSKLIITSIPQVKNIHVIYNQKEQSQKI